MSGFIWARKIGPHEIHEIHKVRTCSKRYHVAFLGKIAMKSCILVSVIFSLQKEITLQTNARHVRMPLQVYQLIRGR